MLTDLLPDADDDPTTAPCSSYAPPRPLPPRGPLVLDAAAPSSGADGRRFLRATLAAWGEDDEQLRETARLLASEPLSNAVRPGSGPVRLRPRRAGRELGVEVRDTSPVLPQARLAAPDAEPGRDLLLVDSLAGSWGTPPTQEGKAVWFSLPLPSPRR
ncbi:ATP-binding protein [Streptomyces sp. NPDC058682]|uniref:ATP-binding protein n=1 Tax=unclassified Streptomyces TaxID=2593676 RepID=UPI00225A6E7F|nr:ATP-binding protein [Streptomyces sp. NBC_01214]MCX4807686.1 ATP-binding protein [Streptomyces sp. NBC_01214]